MERPLKIYVIDDEESIRQTLQWYLEDLGHRVITAPDPVGICDAWHHHDCTHGEPCGDALIIDNSMPGMTGLEFIRLMTKHGCRGVITNKVVMSASFSAADHELAQQLGCKIISKPFSMELLDEWLAGIQKHREPG